MNDKEAILIGTQREADQTCEVLMTELDPNIMKIFTKEVCKNGHEATVVSAATETFETLQ